jgi:predicted nuclease of restriction endonuclease-like (RecB) superfamily
MPKNNKQITPANNTISDVRDSKDYKSLLQELQSIIQKGQYAAYKAVDNIKVQTYWQLGERIVRDELRHKDRADYGKYLIGNLSVDLGLKKSLLYEIVGFFNTYKNFHTVCGKLSWSHYGFLIKIKDEKKRLFYQNKVVLHSWSVRELRKQIKNKLYENTPKNEIEEIFKTKLPATEPQKIFKGLYDFSPLGLKVNSEKELENRILADFELFLKELGDDFAILGRQTPIKIDGEIHLIDMVLYHRGIPCVVLVDLKIGKLNSRDIGQMNKYVGYYKRNKQYEHEKDTIGLIICRDAGREEIIYALDGLEKKIFVAKYKVKLPSEEKIKQAIKEL